MAIVKTNYVPSNRAGSREAMKASVDYMTHWENMQGETVTRTLFGHDGELRKEQAYQMIDEAGEGINFYRIMISPDPETEDAKKTADLWTVTQQTIRKLEKRLGVPLQFVAAEHNDQTEIRHIHSVVLIPRRLSVADLQLIRQAATNAALPRQPEPVQERVASAGRSETFIRLSPREPQSRPTKTRFSCPMCGGGQKMMKLKSGVYRCPECALVLSQSPGLVIETPSLQQSIF